MDLDLELRLLMEMVETFEAMGSSEAAAAYWASTVLPQLGKIAAQTGLGRKVAQELAYRALGFVAAQTERMRLGLLVTGVTYRYPGILLKTATTLDVLSGGRSYLGIGAAWFEQEHRGLGVPFPPLKERFELLEDTLQLAHQMWSPNNGPFHGTHLHLEETLCEPQPVASPHPPIMIGGSGEQKTLRFVAKYADACNIHGGPQLAHKLDVLKRHCDDLGRDYAEIEKTTMIFAGRSFDGAHQDRPASDVLADIRAQAELGVDQVIMKLPALEDAETMRRLAEEIVPVVSETFEVEGLAARGRLMPDVDLAAVDLALRAIAADGRARCVRVAPQSVADVAAASALQSRLEAAGADAGRLAIECSDSAGAVDRNALRQVAAGWRRAGVTVGVWHAGVSARTLPRLEEIGVDYVKVDASHLRGVADDDAVRGYVRSLVALLHGLGLRAYAAGVDDTRELAALWALGFDAAAGDAVAGPRE